MNVAFVSSVHKKCNTNQVFEEVIRETVKANVDTPIQVAVGFDHELSHPSFKIEVEIENSKRSK